MGLMLRAGADAQRVIDGDGWPLERFASHIARVKALRSPQARPLVVLTRTNPIALALLQTRRLLEEAVPELEHAPWLVFHDPGVDPFFESAVAGLGSLEDVSWPNGPVWTAPRGERFLIVVPQLQLDMLLGRLAALELVGEPVSGVRCVDSLAPPGDDQKPPRVVGARG